MTQGMTDFSYLGQKPVPENLSLPGQKLPIGQVGLLLNGYQWMGIVVRGEEIAGLQLDLEVTGTPGYDGQTGQERVFVGESGNDQLGIAADPLAEDPDTMRYTMKLINAIGLAVGVDASTYESWDAAIQDMIGRPFLGHVIAKGRDEGEGYYSRLVDAKPYVPERVKIDEDPVIKQKGGKKPDHSTAPTLGARAGAQQSRPAAPPQRRAPLRTPAAQDAPEQEVPEEKVVQVASPQANPTRQRPAAAQGRQTAGKIPARV